MQKVFTDFMRDGVMERDVDCTPLIPIVAQLNELGVPIKMEHLVQFIEEDFRSPESTNITDHAGTYLKFTITERKI